MRTLAVPGRVSLEEAYRKLGCPSVELVLDLTVFLRTDASRWRIERGVPEKEGFSGAFEDGTVDYGAPYRDRFRQRVRDAFACSGRVHQHESVERMSMDASPVW